MRVVPLHDPDKEQDSVNDSGTATDTPSSVPLKYERRLQRMKDLAKQMPDSQYYFTIVLPHLYVKQSKASFFKE